MCVFNLLTPLFFCDATKQTRQLEDVNSSGVKTIVLFCTQMSCFHILSAAKKYGLLAPPFSWFLSEGGTYVTSKDIADVGYRDLSDEIARARNVVFATADPDQGPLQFKFFSLTPDLNHLFPFSWSRYAFESVQRVVAAIDYLVQNGDDPHNYTKLHHALASNDLVYNGVIKGAHYHSSAGNTLSPFSFVTFKGQSLTDLVAHRSVSGNLTMVNEMNLQPTSYCGDGFATGNEQVCSTFFSHQLIVFYHKHGNGLGETV